MKNFIFIFLLIFWSCNESKKLTDSEDIDIFSQIRERGKIKVLTLYGSTTYFSYNGKDMGHEYELVKSFANSIDLDIEFESVTNIEELNRKIRNGEADLIAYPLDRARDIENFNYTFCGPERITKQVLIQRKEKGKTDINEISDLIGKEVYVEKGSKFESRLINLNRELGGGIIIRSVHRDSISSEDLIRDVAEGKIDFTICDDNIARLNKTFFRNINFEVPVSMEQRSSWAVINKSDSLKLLIDNWLTDSRVITEFPPITKRYFEKNKDPKVLIKFLLNDGRLSAYDSYYKQYSKLLKWDWRLLAALSFEESRFDPNAISHVGARGLMQLMPSTGKSFGLNDQTFTDPEENIKAGSKYINSLQRAFTDIEDPDERINFVLASFHAGLGHILDAKAIARKLGYDPNIWEGNVAECLLLKRDPEIYNDTSLVRCGSYKGETTLAHVSSIKQRYYEFTERVR